MNSPVNPTHARLRRWGGFFALVIPCIVVLWMPRANRDLVVYCAHDARFAQEILQEFEDLHGISVRILYDSEATKSLGLIERIKRERRNPQADVFWNNEFLGMLELNQEGLLEPYPGPGWERIPPAFKDPTGYWAGFGARLRVWVVNTNRIETSLSAIQDTLTRENLSRVAIAKPLYGTTLTHYTVLWDRLGAEGLKALHADWLRRGIRVVDGNAVTCTLVADGNCDLGFTDTDDVFDLLDAGKPIAMLPVQLRDGATVCIPNTVGILKGTHRRLEAQKLVDFLLSEQVEVRLANGKARQIPLGPVPPGAVPPELAALLPYAERGTPLQHLLPARHDCLAWLKTLIQ